MATKDEIIEEAVELADRFPDADDWEVLGHIAFVLKIQLSIESTRGRLALCAFDHGEEVAKQSIWYKEVTSYD